MLYVDIPTTADLRALIRYRGDICVSIYLPTAAAGQGNAADRIGLKNAAKTALDDLGAAGGDKRRVTALAEHFDDLIDDDEFWRYQAHSLAILAAPENVRTFRLPNALQTFVEVADRFHLKPLMRALTFPNACYVLALAEGSTRVVEVSPLGPATTVKLDGMPRDAASAVGKSTINDRSPSGRIQGSEGEKVRLRQFARRVDAALRGLLTGSDIPLVLAATEPLDAIYRSVNSYAQLAPTSIAGSPATLGDDHLAEHARTVLDGLYRERLARWRDRFTADAQRGLTTTDISQAARAATNGAVESMLVDIDEVVPGTVDDAGAVTFADHAEPGSYGVVDEIADRVILAGGEILAVRRPDIPDGHSLAALLRYPA